MYCMIHEPIQLSSEHDLQVTLILASFLVWSVGSPPGHVSAIHLTLASLNGTPLDGWDNMNTCDLRVHLNFYIC